MTHDSNLTISSRPMFFSVLAALNASVVSFFVLWSMADTAAVNRAEEHGFDPSQLLPHDTPYWPLTSSPSWHGAGPAHSLSNHDIGQRPSDRTGRCFSMATARILPRGRRAMWTTRISPVLSQGSRSGTERRSFPGAYW